MEIVKIDERMISELIAKSWGSPRKRAFGMIRSADCPNNVPAIMVNALQPGTYVAPHRHPSPDGREIWMPHKGVISAVLYDSSGNVTGHGKLSRDLSLKLLEIPAQTYHSLVVESDDAVLFELYCGVYNPAPGAYKQYAPWAVPENAPENEQKNYLEKLTERLRAVPFF